MANALMPQMLHEKLRQHAKAFPDRMAVVAADGGLTYKHLYDKAMKIALGLLRANTSRGDCIALYFPRETHVATAICGVLCAGAAYMVVEDDGNTHENMSRLEKMNARLIISSSERESALIQLGLPVTTIDHLVSQTTDTKSQMEVASSSLTADDIAYVLYTSGTTGYPKGVLVSHANIRHYTESLLDALEISQPLAYAHVSTLSADLGNTCIFLSLWTGGTLHLIDAGTRQSPEAMLNYLSANNIDILKITPTHWKAITTAARDDLIRAVRLRYLLLGGEQLTRVVAQECMRAGFCDVLVNHYGPTETTVGVTVYIINSLTQVEELRTDTVPIGRPFGQTSLLVQDGNRFCTSGIGELLVGGPSVAAGYRDDREMTQKAFVAGVDQGQPQARYYKTGDLVQITSDGLVVFLGRIDRQVKINGYRVELEGIESIIRELDSQVDVAAYHVPLGATKALAVAIGPTDASADENPYADIIRVERLLANLRMQVPPYMVPDYIVPLQGPFPRDPNGKRDFKAIREKVVAWLTGEKTRMEVSGKSYRNLREEQMNSSDSVSSLQRKLFGIWVNVLGREDFDQDTNFADVGGGSLEAIQVIGQLQALGYRVTAKSFQAAPNIRALSVSLIAGGTLAPRTENPRRAVRAEEVVAEISFSDAQRWFFSQNFQEPNHWNQALLLESTVAIEVAAFGQAVQDIVRIHPLLRTAYNRRGDGWVATAQSVWADPFSCSSLTRTRGTLSEEKLRASIAAETERLHRTIRLATGEVFKVHFFSLPGGRAAVFIVAHHLSIDAVSWRIILSDLERFYEAHRNGHPIIDPYQPIGFWEWSRHIQENGARLAAGFEYFVRQQVCAPNTHTPPSDSGNTEGHARSAWLALSRQETSLLAELLQVRAGAHLHAAILAAFLQALAGQSGDPGFDVDVESHGRAAFEDNIDVSRVVGWFTSKFRLWFAVDIDNLARTLKRAQTLLDSVPDYGIGYVRQPAAANSNSSGRLCYNFLGKFQFETGDASLGLFPSNLSVGSARGPANNMLYDLRLTGRVINQRLIMDLSFDRQKMSHSEAADSLLQARSLLLEFVGLEREEDPTVTFSQGTSVGLLVNSPPMSTSDESATDQRKARSGRTYCNVLLTGATGFVGCHLLHVLLSKTNMRVHCLVRGPDDASALSRLAETYAWYFPGEWLEQYESRISVHHGDIRQLRYGFSSELYGDLAGGVDAIFHFAADTRLVGSEEDFLVSNVESVRTGLQLSTTGCPKHFHLMSTLAVAGVNEQDQSKVFSEDDLFIGQGFQNSYEYSKYLAEKLVREFIMKGGSGFIYRSGNITGDSVSGRFQRNALDNRLIQTLRAMMRIGKAPVECDEAVLLTPVDHVVEGVLAVSQCEEIENGTFHLEGESSFQYGQILEEISSHGYKLDMIEGVTIADLLNDCGAGSDPTVELARFWSARPKRNIVFDNTRTRRLLANMGVVSEAINREWLAQYIALLVQDGVFDVGKKG